MLQPWLKFKSARMNLGLSIDDIAKLIGLSNPYLSQIETGKVEFRSFKEIMRLCAFYGIDPFDDLDLRECKKQMDEFKKIRSEKKRKPTLKQKKYLFKNSEVKNGKSED